MWRAWDQTLGREIALKRLKPEQANYADNRARFYREARITGQLEHPGIVPVYDYQASGATSHSYYTMRFLHGRTLREAIHTFHAQREATDEALISGPLLDLLAKFASICNTMAFAHARGIIHRDLKGDNVIVGDFGEVVVLDWGLAKCLDTTEEPAAPRPEEDSLVGMKVTATMQGEKLGTPAYMAPEQAQGKIDEIDVRTDVYGLAAILYEILTGRPPFTGADVLEVMKAVIERAPLAPRELDPEIPAELEHICMRGLAKHREDRYPSVSALADEVHSWLATLAERTRTEQERERFFELSLDLLAIIDRRGHLTQSNPAWATQLGWSESARAGQGLAHFVHAEDHELLAAKLEALWAGACVVEFDLRLTRADDDHRWFHCQVRSLPDQAALYLVGRDVTERRRSEQLFQGLLESAPDATCVIDTDGHISLVNAQLERMFGYKRDELIGEHVNILVPSSLRARHGQHVRGYASQAAPRPMGTGMLLEGQHRDGSPISVEISLSPVETETKKLIACAIRTRASDT